MVAILPLVVVAILWPTTDTSPTYGHADLGAAHTGSSHLDLADILAQAGPTSFLEAVGRVP